MAVEIRDPAFPGPWPARRGVAWIGLPLAALVIVLITLDAVTAPRFWNVAVAIIGGVALTAVWLTLLPAAVRDRTSPSLWRRLCWLVVPVIVLLALLGVATGGVARARFELSRPALDQLVAEAAGGRTTFPDRVGLYGVEWVDAWGDEVRVVVGGLFLDSLGFVWFQDDTMTNARADEMCDCDSESLGGGWWTFYEHD
jgi:hypothetical protein